MNIGQAKQYFKDFKKIKPKIDNKLWSACMQNAGYDPYSAGKWNDRPSFDAAFKCKGTERPGMPNQTQSGITVQTLPIPGSLGIQSMRDSGKVENIGTKYRPMSRSVLALPVHDRHSSPLTAGDLASCSTIALPHGRRAESGLRSGQNSEIKSASRYRFPGHLRFMGKAHPPA